MSLNPRPPFAPDGSPDWAKTMLRETLEYIRAMFRKPVYLPAFTVADLPSASDWYNAVSRNGFSSMIYVSDESGGPVPAFTDGTNWLRVTDRNIVS